jgi:TRAP-type C4-dicarboxylate transport system substrate-binding protein
MKRRRTLLGLGLVAVFGILTMMLPSIDCVAAEFTLKFADHSAPTVRTRNIEWWGKEVERRTNGAVKFEYYFAESLAKAKDMPDAIRTGLTDCATFVCAYYPDKVPSFTVVDIGGIGDPYVVNMTMGDLYRENSALQADLDKWNCRLLFHQSVGETVIVFREKVTNLEGFKGKKIRAVGYQAEFMNAIGAVPVPLAHPEIHTGLERGSIDGALAFPYTAWGHGYYEVAPNWVRHIPGNYSIPALINKDVWNKLPKSIQDIMLEVGIEYQKRYSNEVKKEDARVCEKVAEEFEGNYVGPLPPEDLKRWRGLIAPVQEKWRKDMEAKGVPGKEILDQYHKIAERYQ